MTLEEQEKQIQEEVSFTEERTTLLQGLPFNLIKILTRSKAFIAGGSIASVFSSRPICDYDVYFKNYNAYKTTYDEIRVDLERSIKKISTTQHAVTIEISTAADEVITVQLIRIPESFKENPVDLFNEFDFYVCCGLYEFESGAFKLHRDFLKHVAQRKLVYNIHHKYPIASLLRVEKYKAKGYTIDSTNFLKIILHISSLNITTNKQAAEQFQGMYLGAKRPAFNKLLKDEGPLNLNKFLDVIEGNANKVNSKEDLDDMVLKLVSKSTAVAEPDDLPF
jgi:hypothetical protein